jgi:hypothetical protein
MNLSILLLLIPSFASLFGSVQQTRRFLVINAYQRWTHPQSADVKRNDGVPAGTTLSGTAGGELTLDCESQGWVSYTCDRDGCNVVVCETRGTNVTVRRLNPETGPKTEARSQLGRILTALYRREPIASVVLAARTGGNASDAVLLQSARGVHLGPALNRVLEGRYCFRARHLPVVSSAAPQTFTLDWDRALEPEGIAKVSNFAPGAYTLEKGTPGAGDTCNVDRDGAVAWVLVVSEGDFGRVNAQWKENAPWFADLENAGASLSVVATVRHAVLAFLAESVDGK